MRTGIVPAIIRKALKAGCAIHGHVYIHVRDEVHPNTDDILYKDRYVRYYRCMNCPHELEEEIHEKF